MRASSSDKAWSVDRCATALAQESSLGTPSARRGPGTQSAKSEPTTPMNKSRIRSHSNEAIAVPRRTTTTASRSQQLRENPRALNLSMVLLLSSEMTISGRTALFDRQGLPLGICVEFAISRSVCSLRLEPKLSAGRIQRLDEIAGRPTVHEVESPLPLHAVSREQGPASSRLVALTGISRAASCGSAFRTRRWAINQTEVLVASIAGFAHRTRRPRGCDPYGRDRTMPCG